MMKNKRAVRWIIIAVIVLAVIAAFERFCA